MVLSSRMLESGRFPHFEFDIKEIGSGPHDDTAPPRTFAVALICIYIYIHIHIYIILMCISLIKILIIYFYIADTHKYTASDRERSASFLRVRYKGDRI